MNDAICRLVSDPLRNSPSVPPFLPEMTVYVLLISLKGLFGGIFSPLPDSSVGDGSRSLVFCCIWGDHTTDLYMYNIYIYMFLWHTYIYIHVFVWITHMISHSRNPLQYFHFFSCHLWLALLLLPATRWHLLPQKPLPGWSLLASLRADARSLFKHGPLAGVFGRGLWLMKQHRGTAGRWLHFF